MILLGGVVALVAPGAAVGTMGEMADKLGALALDLAVTKMPADRHTQHLPSASAGQRRSGFIRQPQNSQTGVCPPT